MPDEMHVDPEIVLSSGRVIDTSSIEFRERLPVSADLLDQLALATSSDNPGGAFWEAISALTRAVLALEARGVEFPDN